MATLGRLALSLKTTKRVKAEPDNMELVVGLNTDPDFLKLEEIIHNFPPGDKKPALRFHQSISGNILKLIASHELHGGYVFGEFDDDGFVV